MCFLDYVGRRRRWQGRCRKEKSHFIVTRSSLIRIHSSTLIGLVWFLWFAFKNTYWLQADRDGRHLEFAEAYDNSDLKQTVLREVEKYSTNKDDLSEETLKELSVQRATTNGFFFTLKTLVKVLMNNPHRVNIRHPMEISCIASRSCPAKSHKSLNCHGDAENAPFALLYISALCFES